MSWRFLGSGAHTRGKQAQETCAMDPWMSLGIFLLGTGAGALTTVALYVKQIRQLKNQLEAAHKPRPWWWSSRCWPVLCPHGGRRRSIPWWRCATNETESATSSSFAPLLRMALCVRLPHTRTIVRLAPCARRKRTATLHDAWKCY